MLGDQSDKTKNPIKTAMRRRKKNVSFAAPTYVDYSDYDFDTEEEEEAEAEFYAQQQQQQQQAQQSSQQQTAATKQSAADEAASEEAAQVAPLRPRAQKSVQIVDPANSDSKEDSPTSAKGNRTSEEIFETNGVEGPKRKADGTVRDSFFKDDTVETKKITLTPNLLRDDGTVRASTDSDKGVNKRPSFDKLDKEIREEKKSKDKKEKEKKGGFRSLFSRKDKKQKGGDDDDSLGKRSMDAVAEAPERESEDFNDDQAGASPQRNPSKLHKQQPRVEPSLANKSGTVQRDNNGMDLSTFLNEGKLKNVANVPPASMRLVEPDTQDAQENADAGRSNQEDTSKPAASRSAPTRSESVDDSPPQATTAKSRMQIEDSDSGEDDYNETLRQMSGSGKKAQEKPQQESPQQERTQQENPQQEKPQQEEPQQNKAFRPTLPGAFPDSYMSTVSAQSNSTITPERASEAAQRQDRLSESPIEVSPITPSGDKPPALVGDTSSQEDQSSPVSSPSPELIDREDAGGTHRNQDSITTSTSTTTVSNWNDTSLREFFDSGTDIRDLLVVVYDKTDVEPVGPEHPVAGTLFKEQNAKLAEITTVSLRSKFRDMRTFPLTMGEQQLDHMLGDWLARKQRLRGTV